MKNSQVSTNKSIRRTKRPKIMFCTRKECENHKYIELYNLDFTEKVDKSLIDNSWYKYSGTYFNETKKRFITRFTCKSCGASFSTQTFHVSYYKKKPMKPKKTLMKLSNSTSQSNLAEITNNSEKAIANDVLRLGWQTLGANNLLRKYFKITSPIVIDGLENKIRSKQCPHDLNIAVDSASQCIISIDNSYFRAKGRQTEKQKERQKIYDRTLYYEKHSTRNSTRRLIKGVYPLGLKSNILYSDEKKEYRHAITMLGKDGYKLQHETVSSKLNRNFKNPLYPVNYIDREIRKDLETYKRKTVYIAKDMSNSMVRACIYSFYHNNIKIFRKKNKNSGFHYTEAGIDNNVVKRMLSKIFSKRIIYSVLELTPFEKLVWNGQVPNPFGDRKYPLPAYALQ